MNGGLERSLAELDQAWTEAGRRGLELAVRARLGELSPRQFSAVASELLDAAQDLVECGRAAVAQDLAASVLSATRSWAQRQGSVGAYSERLVARGREFAKFVGGERSQTGLGAG